LNLTLSDRQAILKYEVPKQEYQRKLQARISFYLDQPIIHPAISKDKKTTDDQVDVGAMYSIAVLPFANMSTSEETGYFADGLSEDIIDGRNTLIKSFGWSEWQQRAQRANSDVFTCLIFELVRCHHGRR